MSYFQSGKCSWASADAPECRLKGGRPAKAHSWNLGGGGGSDDLKTKSMCRKLNNWGAISPRRGDGQLQEQRRLSAGHAQLLILTAGPEPSIPSSDGP